MRKNKQLVVDAIKGDCMRACLTSMLGLPNDPKRIPLGGAHEWYPTCDKFLRRFGLKLAYERRACWRDGYWMASIKSKNYKHGWHAIVMKGTRVWFDPSTKRRYRAGAYLVGADVIDGGHFLEVVDASKLYKLEEYRRKLSPKGL